MGDFLWGMGAGVLLVVVGFIVYMVKDFGTKGST